MMYPNFTANDLVNCLSTTDHSTRIDSTGGTLVFTQSGGRLLGLYPRADGINTLWINPAITQLLQSGDWMVGGERLWIAPERDFFYTNPGEFEGIHVPIDIDPGSYRQVNFSPLHFETACSISDYSSHKRISATFSRQFCPIEDPYQSGLDFVGVCIDDVISFPDSTRRFSAWSIAQVYVTGDGQAGTVLFPVDSSARLLNYFDPIPDDRAGVANGYARFKIDAQEIFKLAIRPEDIVDHDGLRAIYVSPCPGANDWFCVVKRSHDTASTQSDCVDVARNTNEHEGGAVQSYNHAVDSKHNDNLHAFGEIELQFVHRIDSNNSCSESRGRHELLAYCGSHQAIMEHIQNLLGIDQVPLTY